MANSGGAGTLIWISGATSGVGAGLARTCPYPDARIINMSRSAHPDLENVHLDLTEPATWPAARESFRTELAQFAGQRVIFIHNAFVSGATGYASEVDEDLYFQEVVGNAAAPLVLADWFLRFVRPGYESGLVLMSSAAARILIEGHAVYSAAKAGMEQWVRVVRKEQETRGTGTWVVAVRPGFVDTPPLRAEATLSPHVYPIAPMVAAALEAGEALTPDEAATNIWAALPPDPDSAVLLFGSTPTGV
jgi:benzil reductase ((S)-benzoin forming)